MASRNKSASGEVGVEVRIRSANPSPETAMIENGGSALARTRSSIMPRARILPWAVSITASSLKLPSVVEAM